MQFLDGFSLKEIKLLTREIARKQITKKRKKETDFKKHFDDIYLFTSLLFVQNLTQSQDT